MTADSMDIEAFASQLPDIIQAATAAPVWRDIQEQLGHGHDRLDVQSLFTVVLAAALRERGMDVRFVQHRAQVRRSAGRQDDPVHADVVTILLGGKEFGLQGVCGRWESVQACLQANCPEYTLQSIEESLEVDNTVHQDIDPDSVVLMATLVDIVLAREAARILGETTPATSARMGKSRL